MGRIRHCCKNNGICVKSKDTQYTFLKKMSMLFLFLYINTLFVIAYSEEYNFISRGIFLLCVGFTVLVIIERGYLKFDIPFLLLSLFVIYNCLSMFWVESDTGVNEYIITMLQLLLLYVVFRANLHTEKDLRVVLWGIYFGIIIMCIYTIWFYGIDEIIEKISVGDRIGQEINQANGMGIYCTLLIMLSLYFFLWERKKLCLLAVPLGLFVLIGASSRKSYLLLFVGLLTLLVFRKRKGRLFRLLLFTLIVFAVIYLIIEFAGTSKFLYRIAQMFSMFNDETELTDNSLLTRANFYRYGYSLWKDNPIFGYGPQQFEYHYLLEFAERRPPHSTYIQVLVGYGVLGFSLFYGIYVYILTKLIPKFKKNTKYSILILAFVLFFLANDIGANFLTNKFLYIFLAIESSYLNMVFSPDFNSSDAKLKKGAL